MAVEGAVLMDPSGLKAIGAGLAVGLTGIASG
ncbi:MAG: V-type ATP synthase subunit K, partial [Methanosarcinaceae archaeon]|nr:V-type ATP synthase subunit K [Methanosarcinaceae archaeon]